MIKAIIFDYGGVLCEGGVGIYDYLSKKSFLDKDQIKDKFSNLIHESQKGKISEFNFWNEIKNQEDVFENIKFIGKKLKNSNNNQILVDLLPSLNDKKLGMLSNFSPIYQNRDSSLDYLFDSIVLSYQVGLRKPQKEIFELSLEKLAVKASESLYIDDQQKYVDVAKTLGMNSFRYESYGKLVESFRSFGVILKR